MPAWVRSACQDYLARLGTPERHGARDRARRAHRRRHGCGHIEPHDGFPPRNHGGTDAPRQPAQLPPLRCICIGLNWSRAKAARFEATIEAGSRRSNPALQFAQHQPRITAMPVAVVEAGNCREILAAIVPNISAFSTAISSSVSRQSAEKPGVTTARFLDAALGQRLDSLVGVRLSHSAKPNRDWNVSISFVFSRPSRSRSSRWSRALRRIGIALVDIFLRDAVERGHDQLGLERQRREVASIETASASI